ncbi:MAG: Unknown protein [uncultured Sulfurovum sp.]|uniref:Lipoprotein n=1 Tax=uncultured Sulfurovum sp. TaxID=269237 RepID=A0A6S6SEN1_9BACT|nr:MAG: Unknown protein [uncultured Sulfurovum sp.]
MRFFIVVVLSVFLFVGCMHVEPKVSTSKVVDKNLTKNFKEKNVSIVSELFEKETIESDNLEESHLILNVFNDELYFEKDKVGKDKTKVVIKYLDAYDWEKKALYGIYKKHKNLWSLKQSKELFETLEDDKYLSLCSDRKYWDNLQFEEGQPERDILHSILLIRYLNNLSHGCPQWVESDGKIKNENAKEYINTKDILSLLPHDVIITKVIATHMPKNKKFKKLMKKHKKLLSIDTKEIILKEKRLELEKYKRKFCKPKYERK